METENLKMIFQTAGYEDWSDSGIACEPSFKNRKTRKYEILLLYPACEGTMIRHSKKLG